MKLNAIHHVAIIVSDFQAAKDFYVNKPGFGMTFFFDPDRLPLELHE